MPSPSDLEFYDTEVLLEHLCKRFDTTVFAAVTRKLNDDSESDGVKTAYTGSVLLAAGLRSVINMEIDDALELVFSGDGNA